MIGANVDLIPLVKQIVELQLLRQLLIAMAARVSLAWSNELLFVFKFVEFAVLPLPLQFLNAGQLLMRHLVGLQELFQFQECVLLRLGQFFFAFQFSINDSIKLPLVRHYAKLQAMFLEQGIRRQWLTLRLLLLVLHHLLECWIELLVLGEPAGAG